MLITDQVATAPCTDPIQVRFRLLSKAPNSYIDVALSRVLIGVAPTFPIPE